MRRRTRPLDRRALDRLRRLRLPVGDQGHEIGFEALAIFGRVAQQQFNQPALAGTEMPVHAAARQSVQKRDRLLNQQFLEFVRGHFKYLVIGDVRE
jgi:hypothetical protein